MQEAEMNEEEKESLRSPASGPTPRPSPRPAVVGQHGPEVPGSRAERNRLKRIPVLETRTPIPEGLDAPGAGASRVDAWLRRTFGMSAVEAAEVTGHKSLRQIVHALDGMDSREAPDAPGHVEGEDLPGTPITAEEAEGLPPASDDPLRPEPPPAEHRSAF